MFDLTVLSFIHCSVPLLQPVRPYLFLMCIIRKDQFHTNHELQQVLWSDCLDCKFRPATRGCFWFNLLFLWCG